MDVFEVVVQGELFRISERTQPDGATSYDFAWLNGPADGTYGFTIGRSSGRTAAEDLAAVAGQFVAGFNAPGGLGETDFPDHTPASPELLPGSPAGDASSEKRQGEHSKREDDPSHDGDG